MYVVYDTEGVSVSPVYGVFTTLEKANEAIEILVEETVETILSIPFAESGVTEADRDWLIKDTKNSFAIQVLHNGINKIHCYSDIESSLV